MIEWKGEKLYLVREVAEIVQRSIPQVHAWIVAGKLQARDVAGVRYIAESEIDRLLGVAVEVAPPVPKRRERAKATARARAELQKDGWA